MSGTLEGTLILREVERAQTECNGHFQEPQLDGSDGRRGGRALQFTPHWQPQPVIKEAVEESKGNGRCWGGGLPLRPHT